VYLGERVEIEVVGLAGRGDQRVGLPTGTGESGG